MVLVTFNKLKQLLYIRFLGRIEPEEIKNGQEDLKMAMADLAPGFRLLVDFERMEFMEPTCAAEIGVSMELINQREVGLVVRVIPDPGKDIGMNILSIFHYNRRPRIVTCENLPEAAEALAL